MSRIIYESGDIGGYVGFYIQNVLGEAYGVLSADEDWGAVTPEHLREAADAIEQHRDGATVEFEDEANHSYRAKLDPQGNVTVEAVDGATEVAWMSCAQLGKLIQNVLKAKEALSGQNDPNKKNQ